ncbi:MAG TPA: LacI family DNA-binding transcriptional regulator [Steroidobacteraceae bacterium]|jgi:DNA-binding LacI/PurR family transcriptional regulator|nr:LacI family DNA-binding transcriptional regulator [Steroidobacteraceae bacterium]
MHEKPTSFDIAFLAGVSQPTVSRALRGSPVVSLETRKRIEEIARQLNYRVDKNASNLRSQHSNTLALLLFEDPTPDDSQINPFFLSMLGSITRASARQGYDLLISFQQMTSDFCQDYEDSRKADGIILLGYGDYEEYRPRLDKLVEQGTHFVRWGPVLTDEPGVSVGSDNAQGGFDVTNHLLAQGRRRVAFLGTATSHSPEFFDRYRGYERAMMDARLSTSSALQVDAINLEESGFNAVNELRARGVEFDAIVAASDLIAIGALRALQESGVDVPRQVAVVGFDDIPAASLTNPPLTTVMQDTRRAGELLVETLLRQITGVATNNSVIPTRLVVRKSG